MAGINGALDAIMNFKDASTGAYGGWSQRIHMSRFQLDTPSELTELLSKGRGDYGNVIGAVATPQPQSFNFTLRGAELEMFKLTWLAAQGTLTQGSGSVVDEVVNVKSTMRFKVAGRDISSVVVTSSPSGTTYVAGTDYTVTNPRLGIIDVIAGSSLATAVSGAGAGGLNLLVDYSRAAVSGIQLRGAASPNIIAQVLGDGINRANLKPFDVFIPEAIIAPQGGIDLLADNFAECEFTARMSIVAPYTEPFTVNWPQGV